MRFINGNVSLGTPIDSRLSFDNDNTVFKLHEYFFSYSYNFPISIYERLFYAYCIIKYSVLFLIRYRTYYV